MKWTFVAIVAGLLAGYNLYDDFDPGILKGKNVVITGGSKGIGEQMAYHYARMGARLLITARTESNLQKVVEGCKKEGDPDGVYLYHVADMSDPDSAERVIKAAEQHLGGIDYLVLNHITVVPLRPWLSTAENITLIERVMNVNFMAYVRLASSAIKLLQRSSGSIVVVSSVAGKIPQPYLVPYSSSKFALDGFFSGLRQELYMHGVDVSVTICYIGLTDTDSGTKLLRDFGGEKILSIVSSLQPDDVAYVIVRGGAMRQRSVYYPYSYARIIPIAYQFVPSFLDKLTGAAYARD